MAGGSRAVAQGCTRGAALALLLPTPPPPQQSRAAIFLSGRHHEQLRLHSGRGQRSKQPSLGNNCSAQCCAVLQICPRNCWMSGRYMK